MPRDRHVILQLLAAGRINAGEAERLLAAASADGETVWWLAGCVAIVAVAQPQGLVPELAHLLNTLFAGILPAFHHSLSVIASSFGGMS
jgi:hypothetical protein